MYTSKVINQLYDKKQTKQKSETTRRRRAKKLTLKEKADIVKERYNLNHGGTKQNKKKKRRK